MSEPRSPAEVYLSKWPKKSDTHRTMRSALDRLARALGGAGADHLGYPWHKLRYETVLSISAQLLDAGLSARSVNKVLAALRGVLDAAWRLELMPDEAYRKIEIKNLPVSTLPSGHALDDLDVEKLSRTLDEVPDRDAALIVVLFACGLRRVEAVRLRREHYDPEAQQLKARGKRNKERQVPVPPEWAPVLDRHWQQLPPRAPMFSSEKGPLTRDGVSYLVAAFVERAGAKHFTPHDLRRTFITNVCKKDVLTAQKLAGHSSPAVTAIYDRRGDEVAREAVATIRRPKSRTKSSIRKPGADLENDGDADA